MKLANHQSKYLEWQFHKVRPVARRGPCFFVEALQRRVIGMNEKGTTLIELLLAAMIAIAVGVALILPSVSAW
jgi:hypothetical protein